LRRRFAQRLPAHAIVDAERRSAAGGSKPNANALTFREVPPSFPSSVWRVSGWWAARAAGRHRKLPITLEVCSSPSARKPRILRLADAGLPSLRKDA